MCQADEKRTLMLRKILISDKLPSWSCSCLVFYFFNQILVEFSSSFSCCMCRADDENRLVLGKHRLGLNSFESHTRLLPDLNVGWPTTLRFMFRFSLTSYLCQMLTL